MRHGPEANTAQAELPQVGARAAADGAAVAQASPELKIHDRVWLHVLRGKIENQAAVLRLTGLQPTRLEKETSRPDPNESAAARYYWKHFLLVLLHLLENPKVLRLAFLIKK